MCHKTHNKRNSIENQQRMGQYETNKMKNRGKKSAKNPKLCRIN